MTAETFRGADLKVVLEAVRRAYGEDAMIIRTRGPAEAGAYEVTVLPAVRATSETIASRPRADRPYLIALVGPAGAGKSTAAAKLALQLRDERRRVALLTLDCYKIGALEQMQLFSELLDVPLDMLQDASEVSAVRQRIAAYDTVVIDTPGRRSGRGEAAWAPMLAALAPDEVHLVVHAGLRPELLRRTYHAWAALAPDHVLPMHADLLSEAAELDALLAVLRLPSRWSGHGAELAEPLRAAPRPPVLDTPPLHERVPEHAASLDIMLRQLRSA